jgi:hypothetical protein
LEKTINGKSKGDQCSVAMLATEVAEQFGLVNHNDNGLAK